MMQDVGATPRSIRAETRRSNFRPDIDGLRALAVLLVVAFHVGIPGFEGGFVGVDVFFVISGFLITRLLLDEERRTGSIALGQFWLRRVRRLVPALGVVIIVTLGASLLVFSALAWKEIAREGAAAALYVSNLLFARDSTRYFDAAGVARSPFLHTWSLGIEEQFYVVWPVFIMAVVAGARRCNFRKGPSLIVALGALAAASFVISYHLSERGSPWAFFSLPTRAWEFALAGCAGVLAARLARAPRGVRVLWSYLGLALILYAGVAFDSLMPYPGTAALVPVAGTALLIVSSTADDRVGPSKALIVRPLQWLGRVSYAWYLWHWPFIVLSEARYPSEGAIGRAIAAVAALGAAALTHHFIENPIRFGSWISRSKQTICLGIAITAVALVSAGSVAWAAHRELRDPLLARLARARADRPKLDGAACDASQELDGVPVCVYGDARANRTVLLVGDSHAAHWLPGFDKAGHELGIRIVSRVYGGCPAFDVAVAATGKDRQGTGCSSYRKGTDELRKSPTIDAIIVSNAAYGSRMIRSPGDFVARSDEESQWKASARRFIDQAKERSVPIGLVLDNPYLSPDPIECAAREHSLARCDQSRQQALAQVARFRRADRGAVQATQWGVLFDPARFMCDHEKCRVAPHRQIAYSDATHLTKTFAEQQGPRLGRFLADVLAENTAQIGASGPSE